MSEDEKQWLHFLKRRKENINWDDCGNGPFPRCGGCDECLYMQAVYHYHGKSICYKNECKDTGVRK